jgi:hypothetical protein
MVHTRARERSAVLFPLFVIIAAIAVFIWTLLPGPSPTKVFEDRGFTNVKTTENEEGINIYTATVNDCTVEIYKTADTEVWNVILLSVRDGKSVRELPQPEAGWTFLGIQDAGELQENARFTAACPPP